MADDFDDGPGSFSEWVAAGVIVAAIALGILVQLNGAPFMLIAPMAAVGLIGAARRW